MIYVGIDWADESHRVFITDDSAQRLDSFSIQNTHSGVETLFKRVRQLVKDQNQVLFALETSKGLLINSILDACYTVYSINPKSVDRYRDRYKVSGHKTDDFDAMVLANILRTDRHNYRPILPDSNLTRELKILTREHTQLTRLKTILTNQLTSCLKDYYPAALKLFCKLDQQITLAFLKDFPTYEQAKQVPLKQWCKFLSKHHYRVGINKKANEIYEELKEPQFNVEPFIADAKSRYMLTLVQQLELLLPQIEFFETKIEQLLKQHTDGSIFLSLPGASVTLAARMVSEFGDNRQRYTKVSSVQAEAGTAPVTESSGNTKFVHFRKGCRKSFRDTMHQFAFCSIRQSPWAYQRYKHYIDSGKRHSHAIRCLANAWLEIIFPMWKNHTPYSEQQHLLKYVKDQKPVSCRRNFNYLAA
ncbi:MAG: IS110 family transposase [Elusimicrobiota bacterium]|nr:IS110 family transposase [Elusimicrobiota bacterium]